MAVFLRYVLTAAVTFAIGSFVAWPTHVRSTLEDISENPSAYDGKMVELETFAQLGPVFDNSLVLGEPFEKKEIIAFVELSTVSDSLREQLADGLFENEYNRVRVVARGRIRDDCAPERGIAKCCFGWSLTLLQGEITPVGPIERYTRPR